MAHKLLGRSRIISLVAVLSVMTLVAATILVGVGSGVESQNSVDINEIFWCEGEGEELAKCDEARELVLNHCTACHLFVPIVTAQKTEEEWDATLDVHRERVSDVSDEDFAKIRKYLVSHFNPDEPVPELPPALLNMGTNQAF